MISKMLSFLTNVKSTFILASLDRGFGMIATYRRYATDFKKYSNGIMESVRAPDCVLD